MPCKLVVQVGAADGPKRWQPGDVVLIMPADHKFSPAELNCGQYKFIDVPDSEGADLVYLVEPEVGKDGKEVDRRKVRLDVSKLGSKTARKADLDAAKEDRKKPKVGK